MTEKNENTLLTDAADILYPDPPEEKPVLEEPETPSEVIGELEAESPSEYIIPEEMLAKIDAGALQAVQDAIKGLGLNGEGADKFIESVLPIAEAVKNSVPFGIAGSESWAKLSASDPEIGGKDFKDNLNIAKKALVQVGSKKLLELFNETSLGDHPEIIRMFVNVGKIIAEDTPHIGTKGNASTGRPLTFEEMAEVIYK